MPALMIGTRGANKMKFPFPPKLKMVAMAFLAIVTAFFSGRLTGWGDGRKHAYKAMAKKEQKRKENVQRKNQKINHKVARLNRNQLGKWLRPPRNR